MNMKGLGGTTAGVILAAALAAGAGTSDRQAVRRSKAVEVTVTENEAGAAVLGRPLALACDADHLYIADALDCAVKIFSKEGRFLRSFGRKGEGPGELSFPSGVSAAGDSIAVADQFNHRIQIYDGEGMGRGGFKVPFAPDKIYTLGANKLLVTRTPTGRKTGELLLHIYDTDGGIVWEGLEARTSPDPVYDAFRNMILVCLGGADDFNIIFRTGERSIYHFSASGALLSKITVDDRLVFRTLEMPFTRGVKALAGFCWAAAGDRGLFYLSAPEFLAGRDLGPGRTLSLIDGQGRLQAVVELPCAVHRFLVADGRMFAIDDGGGLRIFEVGR
jgi:hypothetical protein